MSRNVKECASFSFFIALCFSRARERAAERERERERDERERERQERNRGGAGWRRMAEWMFVVQVLLCVRVLGATCVALYVLNLRSLVLRLQVGLLMIELCVSLYVSLCLCLSLRLSLSLSLARARALSLWHDACVHAAGGCSDNIICLAYTFCAVPHCMGRSSILGYYSFSPTTPYSRLTCCVSGYVFACQFSLSPFIFNAANIHIHTPHTHTHTHTHTHLRVFAGKSDKDCIGFWRWSYPAATAAFLLLHLLHSAGVFVWCVVCVGVRVFAGCVRRCSHATVSALRSCVMFQGV